MSTSDFNRFRAIDFSHTIERLIEGFKGREWLFDQLDEWLHQENGEKFYLLTGEPGIGKSAIAAKLTQKWAHQNPEQAQLAAYHFCRAGDVETVKPGRVVRSLATQLVKTLPHYGKVLQDVIDPVYLRIQSTINIGILSNSQVIGIYVDNLKELDPKEEFRLLIQEPLSALSGLYAQSEYRPPTPKIILIDSLDEAASTTGQETMVTLLASLYQLRDTLPLGVRFLLTSRPDQATLNQFLPLQPNPIDEMEANNLRDIEIYIRSRVDEQLGNKQLESEISSNNTPVPGLKTLQQRLVEAELTSEKLIHEIKKLSHGNFLYTKLLLNSIVSGEQSIKNLANLPRTLNDLYHRILRFRCSFRGWLKHYQPILGTLSVALEPISKEQLSKLLGIDAKELHKELNTFQQFLDVSQNDDGQPLYTIFHQSFRDYLLDGRHNYDFWCDPKEEHQKIVDHYKHQKDDWSQCDAYGLKHVVSHLINLTQYEKELTDKHNRFSELAKLLTRFSYLETKTSSISPYATLEDLNRTLDLLPLDIDSETHLSSLLHALNAVSRSLEKWSQPILPAFLAQEIYNFSKVTQLDAIAEMAKQRLREIAEPYLSLHWKASNSSPALERTVGKHDGVVTAIVVTPDGNYVVSASAKGTLKLWNLKTGEEVQRFSGNAHDSQIRALTITSDGNKLITGGWDCKVKIWDFDTGQFLNRFIEHDDWVTDVTLTRDDRYVISASYDCKIKIWDLQTDNVSILHEHTSTVRGLTLMNLSNSLISVSDDGLLMIWDLDTNECIEEIDFDAPILKIRLTSDDNCFAIITASSFSRNIIDSWIGGLQDQGLSFELSRQIIEEAYICGPYEIYSLKFYSSKLVDHRFDEAEEIELISNTSGISNIVIEESSCRIIASFFNGCIKIYNWEFGEVEKELFGHEKRVNTIKITPDSNFLLSAGDDTFLKLWNLQNLDISSPDSGHSSWLRHVAITLNNKFGVTLDGAGQFKIWRLEDGVEMKKSSYDFPKLFYEFQKDRNNLENIGSTDNNGLFNFPSVSNVSMSLNSEFIGISLLLSELEYEFTHHLIAVINVSNGMYSSFISPIEPFLMDVSCDGSKVVLADMDSKIYTFENFNDPSIPALEKTFATDDKIGYLKISCDGKYLIASSDHGILKILDLDDRNTIFVHDEHNDDFLHKANFVPNHHQIISETSDGLIKIWDFDSGDEYLFVSHNCDRLLAMMLTNKDSEKVVAVGADYSLNIWDRESCTQLAKATTDGLSYTVAATADGKSFLTGDRMGNIYFYRYVDALS
jgi:WD40 repeat protein